MINSVLKNFAIVFFVISSLVGPKPPVTNTKSASNVASSKAFIISSSLSETLAI